MSETTILAITKDPSIIDATRFGFPSDVKLVLAHDAREAHSLSKGGLRPRVVLIDIHTGSAGGFAAASELAEDPRAKAAPIMMLLEREQDLWLARQAGARIIRVKPIETSDLVSDVMSLLEPDPTTTS